MSVFLAFVQTRTFQQASKIKYGPRLRDDEVVSQTVAHFQTSRIRSTLYYSLHRMITGRQGGLSARSTIIVPIDHLSPRVTWTRFPNSPREGAFPVLFADLWRSTHACVFLSLSTRCFDSGRQSRPTTIFASLFPYSASECRRNVNESRWPF